MIFKLLSDFVYFVIKGLLFVLKYVGLGISFYFKHLNLALKRKKTKKQTKKTKIEEIV